MACTHLRSDGVEYAPCWTIDPCTHTHTSCLQHQESMILNNRSKVWPCWADPRLIIAMKRGTTCLVTCRNDARGGCGVSSALCFADHYPRSRIRTERSGQGTALQADVTCTKSLVGFAGLKYRSNSFIALCLNVSRLWHSGPSCILYWEATPSGSG